MQKKKKKKNNNCAMYGEDAVTECVKSSFWSFVLEIPHWMMLHNRVDQLKLIAIKSRH